MVPYRRPEEVELNRRGTRPPASAGATASVGAAVGSGLLLALITSGGILGERISGGDVLVALGVNVLVTSVSILVLLVTLERRRGLSFLAQGAGAVLGIALVHLLVHLRLTAELPWLSERPAQLVNDATAVAATLILVWACAKQLDARVLIGAFLLVTAYRATAGHWHLDRAPGGFELTVQQLVVIQFAASAFGMLLFTHLHRRRA